MPVPGPVLVVGAGPTGLVAALLLARHGVEVIVVERRDGVHPLPRAVHLDDESVRILQAAGVADGFTAVSRPAAGLRLLDARLRPFAEFRRSESGLHGWPESNLFDQPALEELLRDAVAAQPLVTLHEGVEVAGVEQRPDGLSVRLRTERGHGAVGHDGLAAPTEGRPRPETTISASAVLGCDGAHSTVRDLIGARMRDLGFTERWFVLDVASSEPLPTWGGVDQVCDPARAGTFLPLPGDRYRWEWRMHDGEDAADLAERIPELTARWTGAVDVDVLRAAEYTFAARLADRWRDGRVFLLGDAAHLTPPFIGQGLGAGLRDAHNLAWKLVDALARPASAEALLESYRLERAPHAEAVIRGAVRVGRAMTGGPGAVAALRRPLVAGALRIPGVRARASRVLTTRFPAGESVDRRRHRRDLVGAHCPQVRIGDRRLDDVLGPGWALVTDGPVPDGLRARAERVGAGTVRVGELGGWLAAGRAGAALLRPDRIVAATAPRPG
ncbi:3-(3-hydroxy-phenyl)propionate hydroxylase [Pseudonocardia sediminis]|uniref:3-(3-hydroxy-phenyl)propionate hydroxylase n=1 Tax=Pseudonocardia sediminis TaxID=1397368 RepID=A0A4Q7US40_PSEST|nr:bifunctional 3-(3-hydroxy-phenyl)propionate/3-hydroxycinnamic acid hydroxylase [Pseudonocardia sediminis]RZT84572.1 3-(3-hydroxy-phenyl)propionate hydroxylase [Pseudonocardia sediminis]